MKKIISLLLALMLLLSIAGCNVNENAHTPTTIPETTVPDTTAATEPEETQPVTTEPEETLPPQTDPAETLPPQTDPPKTDPPVTEPEESLPPQTDPDRPGWDEQETEPPTEKPTEPPTEPPTTLPPQTDPPQTDPPQTDPPAYQLDPNGSYTTKDDVALYIYLYGRLPNNFITKKQAENRYGWSGGSLSKYGMCIGGDRFYNNEGLLPRGYTYYECDIDTLYSSKRGAKRLVFTYSGLIYYTSDHYGSFTLLYGNP